MSILIAGTSSDAGKSLGRMLDRLADAIEEHLGVPGLLDVIGAR